MWKHRELEAHNIAVALSSEDYWATATGSLIHAENFGKFGHVVFVDIWADRETGRTSDYNTLQCLHHF